MSVTVFHRLDPATATARGRVAATVRRTFAERPGVMSIAEGRVPLSRNGYRYVRPPRESDVLYYCLSEGNHHRGRRISPARLEPAEFGDLADALAFAAERILPARHSYIVHLRDGDCQAGDDYMSLQVVDRHRVLGDGDCGFLAHLAFDPACGQLGPLANLLGSGRLGEFLEYRLGGVPCYGLPLDGEPVEVATRLGDLLELLHGRRPSARATIRVDDEGPPMGLEGYVVAHTGGGVCRGGPRMPPAGPARRGRT